jgi:hypothetical protein
MKYMVLMYSRPAETRAMSGADLEVVLRKHEALRGELGASGELLNGAGLTFPEDTTTIRLDGGTPLAVQGSIAVGDEHVTAYYVLECADREQAVAIGERLLDSHVTAVEVRHIHDSTGMDG